MTSFRVEKCCHVVNAHAASARRICSNVVRQFLVHSTFVFALLLAALETRNHHSSSAPLAMPCVLLSPCGRFKLRENLTMPPCRKPVQDRELMCGSQGVCFHIRRSDRCDIERVFHLECLCGFISYGVKERFWC